jgi:hypothetical protein
MFLNLDFFGILFIVRQGLRVLGRKTMGVPDAINKTHHPQG